jgi:hypothetical protein
MDIFCSFYFLKKEFFYAHKSASSYKRFIRVNDAPVSMVSSGVFAKTTDICPHFFGTLLGLLPKRRLYLSSDAPQILTVLSSLPLTSDLVSGLHDTVDTRVDVKRRLAFSSRSLSELDRPVPTKLSFHCELVYYLD